MPEHFKRIVLPCRVQPSDAVVAQHIITTGEPSVSIQMFSLKDDTVILSRERARELFNWLGVWLHTQ